MKPETISLAFGHIDDEFIESADALRNRKSNSHWKRWTALAACLCVIVSAAAVFFQGFPIFGASCGSSLGVLVDGNYYYETTFAFYRYNPSENKREYLMSRFNVYNIGFLVDEYGLYYVKGRSLYVRENETGKLRVLYTADKETTTHISFSAMTENISFNNSLSNGQIDITLYNTRNPDMEHYRVVRLDGKTGEIIWQRTLTYSESYTLDYGVPEYHVGDSVYSLVYSDEGMYHDVTGEVYRDGQPVFPEGKYNEYRFISSGDSLVICCFDYAQDRKEYFLATPDDAFTEIPSQNYLAGTNDYLIFSGEESPGNYENQILYSYNIKTGETVLLYSDDGMNAIFAVTDGTWFYTAAPWGRSGCWKLVYDGAGKLTGLELWAKDM